MIIDAFIEASSSKEVPKYKVKIDSGVIPVNRLSDIETGVRSLIHPVKENKAWRRDSRNCGKRDDVKLRLLRLHRLVLSA